MPAKELAQTIETARRAGGDRLVEQVTLEILRQLGGGAVPALALLRHRPGDDPVELAGELAPQARRFAPATLGAGARVGGVGAEARARQGRLLVADAAQDLRKRRVAKLEGGDAREQLVEQRAERVDVGAGVEIEAHRRLLRAHVGGRADELAEAGGEGAPGETGIDGAGDPEVDHLGDGSPFFRGDEDVAGLQVAVNDPLLVRRVHGMADGGEELEALADGQAARVAVFDQRRAVHQLHREVGAPFGRRAGVEDAGDRAVIHPRQDLAFDLEAPHDLAGVHPELDQLQCDAALDRRLLDRLVDLPHTALADLADDAIGADLGTRRRVESDRRQGVEEIGPDRRGVGEVRREERVELAPELAIGAAGEREGTLRARHLRCARARRGTAPRAAASGRIPCPEAPPRRYQDCPARSFWFCRGLPTRTAAIPPLDGEGRGDEESGDQRGGDEEHPEGGLDARHDLLGEERRQAAVADRAGHQHQDAGHQRNRARQVPQALVEAARQARPRERPRTCRPRARASRRRAGRRNSPPCR